MKHYSGKHRNRKSIRLKGYDYSRRGLYFMTICCQNRSRFFGEVKNGKMILNDAGKMIDKWYWELQNKYPDKICREMVVMPNHFHCILENAPVNVIMPLRGHPETNQKYNATIGNAMGWLKTMTTNEYIRGVKQFDWH
jgi:REP element-mobilizing transposase RayT